MSDQGEKTCPLCAEEMDVTDQQLKPCKCGYEICVWCWHHIMDMAEKDESEGRCPACRTPYNKEKVVGMAAKCERLVAEMNTEKKLKSQKAKSKTSEGRRQLGSVRVIQRNLVYIVGLPLNLADEMLLQRRDYFGQYGKALKVSISRTAAGAIQQFSNNTCSVYITYSKEEEAVRCIQAVHGFVLDGRPLRACFGTTKYCHAWLRNVPCSNPECLYLHEIGSQEDSFTKDEIISAYSRSRVQQITGATNNLQRRSGNVLPPPADESHTNSSASSVKPISKSSSNNSASVIRISPPNITSGVLGTCASNSQPPTASLACPNGPSKQKPERCIGLTAFSTAVVGATQDSLSYSDVGKKLISNEEGQMILHKIKQEPLDSVRQSVDRDYLATGSEASATPGLTAMPSVKSQIHSSLSLDDKDRCISLPPDITNSFDHSGQCYGPVPEKDSNARADENIQSMCSYMASMNIDRCLGGEHAVVSRLISGSLSDNSLVIPPQNLGLQQNQPELFKESSKSTSVGKTAASTDDICGMRQLSDLRSDSLTREPSYSQVVSPEVEDDLHYFEEQRLKDPEVITRTSYFPNNSNSFNLSDHSRIYSSLQNERFGSTNFNHIPQILDNKVDPGLLMHSSAVSVVSDGCPRDIICSSLDVDRHSYLHASHAEKQHVWRFEGEAANAEQNGTTDVRESSIISNILSMGPDTWDESLTSPPNLVRLLGKTDRQQGSLKFSSSWKAPTSSQSRFSFARQEESNQVFDIEASFNNVGPVVKDSPLDNRYFHFNKLGDYNGFSFSTSNTEKSDIFTSSHSQSSNQISVSRSQVSAPPGFSMPNRMPPPGFASHERMEQTFDAMTGNHLSDMSPLLRNSYQAPSASAGNMVGSGDIEFTDPAILAVGKERLPCGLNHNSSLDVRSNISSQLSAFEDEARLHLLMQRSLSPLQNQRFTNMVDGFASLNDAHSIPSRVREQTLATNLSPFSQLGLQQSRTSLMPNGQWDGWSEVQTGNDLGMTELLRAERLGFNKLYSGYEDSKFRMPSSGDLYNRTYGI
ncbi:hypothetical protein NMG60_11033906 [Bertholletia excelsa]